jgi:hypothetical protein
VWSDPAFNLTMNEDSHGQKAILVDMFAFAEEFPNSRKNSIHTLTIVI